MGVTSTTNSAVTYTPIATVSASGSTAVMSFTSIPGTYTDLVIVTSPLDSATNNVDITFNSDTATNYSRTIMYGNGSAASGTATANASGIRWTYGIGTGNNTIGVINIMNYANTTKYKSSLIRFNQASVGTGLMIGLWRSTSAITRIDLTSSGNYSAGATATLYGILAA